MKFETVSERARRRGCTIAWIYTQLAAGRIVGAVKRDGRWCLPLEQTQPPTVRDWKCAQAGDNE